MLNFIKNGIKGIMPGSLIRQCGAMRAAGKIPGDLNGKKVLIIQLNALGDCVMTIPLIASLKQAFPNVSLDTVSSSLAGSIFESLDSVSTARVIRINRFKIDKTNWQKLRSEKYDVVIDCSAIALTACLTGFITPESSIGFARTVPAGNRKVETGPFYTESVPYSEDGNITKMILLLGERWHKGSITGDAGFKVAESAKKQAEAWFKDNGIDPAMCIMLHPGAKWPPKRWPEGRWIELLKMMSKDLSPVFVGNGKDMLMIDRIRQRVNRSIPAIIDADIPLVASVLSMSRAAICMDSFVMHLAALLKKPVIALYGPVNPERSLPLYGNVTFLYSRAFCSPCTLYYTAGRCQRGTNFCMYHIKAEQVWNEFLKSTKQGAGVEYEARSSVT